MHWLVLLGVLWAVIYVASLLTALIVNASFPVDPFVAILSGLFVGMIGVLYLASTYADRRLRMLVADLVRRERPSLEVPRDDEIGGIVEELQETEQRRSNSEDTPE